MVATVDDDKVFFAFSHADLKRRRALLFFLKSVLYFLLISFKHSSTNLLSKSSPPK